MSIETIATLVMGAGLSLATSLVLVKLNRIEKKADRRHQEDIDREVLLCTHRTDESVLLLEVVEAVQTKRINGELKLAKEQFERTNREYEQFVRTQAGIKIAEHK